MTFDPIGEVRAAYEQPGDPDEMRKRESTIVLDTDYEAGLYRIERNDYITVLFHIHESDDYRLRGDRRYGETRGVFACRSPHRPNAIGSTTVELLERNGPRLTVYGLDAIDGTPVLDVKPHAPGLDCPPRADDERRGTPRDRVETCVGTRDLESLLLDAGELHGHHCPYLALGVMAGVHALRELGVASVPTSDVLARIEDNGCFADGIQYVTGCTFGNGTLRYRDHGKTAVTVWERGAPGFRVRLNDHEAVTDRYPHATDCPGRHPAATSTADPRGADDTGADAAFDIIGRPLQEFCAFDHDVPVDATGPDSREDRYVRCPGCGEQLRASKTVETAAGPRCIPCAGLE